MIIETLSKKGEAVIARRFSCVIRVFRQAAGGGALTSLTTAAKFGGHWIHLGFGAWGAPFVVLGEMVFLSMNYIGSFVLMQRLGFKLATKLPSLTAVTWVEARARGWGGSLGGLIRTQIAATLGNLLAVVPATILFHLIYVAAFGSPFLDPKTSEAAIRSLDPYQSLTIPFAFLTGILLCLSNWAAGAFSVKAQNARSAQWMRKLAPTSSNLFLGFFLAIVPSVGKAFSLPLDVRHMTLSAGALTLSVCSLGWKAAFSAGLSHALEGVVWIGFLNFGVSFMVSVAMAFPILKTRGAEGT